MATYKPTGSLKNFVDAGKVKTRVLGSVERHVLSRPQDDRRSNVLHPSDMVDSLWCHRASYFHILGSVPVKREYSFQLMSVFQQGNDIHKKWQNWFGDMGNLYGLWECQNCRKKGYGISNYLNSVCEDDDCYSGFEYKEVPLDYPPLHIAGHSDGLLVGLGDPLMLEIKSIGAGTLRWEVPELFVEHGNNTEKTWEYIKEPFMKHVNQVQIYMKLAELLKLEYVPQEAVLIYELKSNQDVKEFVVTKSDFGISQYFEQAQMITDAVASRTPPPCNISANGCKRCRGYL